MPMHPEFAEWYRTASITPEQSLLEQRWAAVEEAAAGLDGDSIASLLRLFVIRTSDEPTLPATVEELVRKHDTTYSRRHGAEEARVLAGAVLRQTLEAQYETAVASAMGLVAAAFGSRADKVTVPQHIAAAHAYLSAKADQARAVNPPRSFESAQLTRKRYDSIATVDAFQQQNIAAAGRDAIFAVLNEGMAKASNGAALSSVWHAVQTVREEIDLLWWLQVKFSRDLNLPFHAMSGNAAAPIFAMELADLTAFVPGPEAILGVVVSALSATISPEKGATLAQIVNAAPRAWRSSRSKNFGIQDLGPLCPILFAITKSLDTDGESDWFPVYRKQCEVQLDVVFPLSDIAMQVYRERLFARAIAEVDDE